MDLESESSLHESVEDNEAISSVSAPERLANSEEIKVQENGSCVIENNDDKNDFGSNVVEETKAKENEVAVGLVKPDVSTSPVTTKGYGLKKWRRIKRDPNKEGGSSVDSGMILKQEVLNSAVNPSKRMQVSADSKQKSEGSASSTNAVMKSLDGFAGLSDMGLLSGHAFSAGTDSENSEDQGSKSSTAASGPKMRFETPVLVGFPRDKAKMRSLSGKNLSNSVQRGQLGKGRIETGKKARGERVKIEKENSHSSVESDMRSSNFLFMQGSYSATGNGRQSRTSMNYDGENGDEVHGSVWQDTAGMQGAYHRNNEGESEGIALEHLAAGSSSEAKEERSENHGSPLDHDPLVESISSLQSVQEALEKEVQKFMEIGKEDVQSEDLVPDSRSLSEFALGELKLDETNSSEQLQPGDNVQGSFCSVESDVIVSDRDLDFWENKLKEKTAVLKNKEARVAEVEAISNRTMKEDTGGSMKLHEDDKYIATEFDDLFKRKIEAEVEYLVVSRAIQSLRVAAVDQISVLEEQKATTSEHAQMLSNIGHKAAVLKKRAQKLENYYEDSTDVEEKLKLQNGIWKYTSFFFIQLVLFIVILGLVVLQLSSDYAGVVPT